MSVPEFVVGQVIDGKFTIESLLGRSDPLATYRAAAADRRVALKIYDPRLESFPEVVSALARSETVTRELPNEAVARIVEGGNDPDTGAPYTVTLFDPDPSLAEVVAWTPLSPTDVVTFVRNLAKVLDEVHSRGIAHLSLKPTNVFVGSAPSYKVRLVDFAMSVVRRALPAPDEMGPSDAWLAPEQVATGAPTGPAADIFACALLGFYALTGTSYWRAFQSDSPGASAWRRELYGERVPVSVRAAELSVSLDRAFDAVFARALSVSARERFQTAGDFAEALRVAVETPWLVPHASFRPSGAPMDLDDFAVDLESSSPTSMSAVVLAPAVLAASPEGGVPVDVPPPPAQMEAVLAAFETVGSRSFHIDADRETGKQAERSSVRAAPVEPLLVRIRTGLTIPPPRNWSPALWTAAVVGGLAIAGAIVYPLVHKSGVTPGGVAATNVPAVSDSTAAASSMPPAATPAGVDNGSSAATTTAAPQSPTHPAKPESKTVRSPGPVHSSGATSGPTRKPCSKALKPCK